MNIKDAYIHNGDAILKDIKVENSSLKKILAGKKADDTYLGWETVCDLTGIKPNAAGIADKVGHKLTFSGGVTGTWDGSADKTVAIPTKSSWNYDDVYLKLTGNGTTNPLTGTIYIKDVNGIILNSKDKDLNIWEVYGNSGAWTSQYGFNLQYTGTGSGNNNDLVLWAHNKTETHVESYRIKQDGTFIFKAAPKVGTNIIYHAGNLTASVIGGLGTLSNNISGNAATATNATYSNFFVGCNNTITVEGDSNTYYPVMIVTTTNKKSPNIITIWKDLGSKTASYPENHSNGSSSMLYRYDIRNCYWDGNGGYCTTLDARYMYARLVSETMMLNNGVGNFCIWLRGGGTEYNINTSWYISSTDINVYYSSTNVGTSTYPVTIAPRTDIGNEGVFNTMTIPCNVRGAATASWATNAGSATYVLDANSSTATTFAYSKAGLNYSDYEWLAGWNGYELRAVSKSQFAQASHTHTKSQITDFPTSLPASGGYANEIARKSMLDSQEKIDNFITANRLEYATFKTTDANNVDFAGNDGMILSIPWTSTIYGAQIAFDDSTSGTVKVRGKSDTWGNWYTLLHSGNYTSYTVKKDGTGASGTWGINITGSAGSIAWGNVTGKPSSFTPSSHTHSYTTIESCTTLDINSDNFSAEVAGGSNSVTTKPSGVDAFGVIKLKTASGWYGQILLSSDTAQGLYYRTSTSLSPSIGWQKLLDSSNYNSYAPKLDGTGATGTWKINISGNAASATKATKDGNGNIITNTYLPLSGGTMSNTNVVTNLNADLLDGYHAGVTNGSVGIFVPWPNNTILKNEGLMPSEYGTSEFGYPDNVYLQSICKWAIAHYTSLGDVTLIGAIAPNSSGTCILHLYSSSGKDSSTLLPRYCSGTYTTLSGYIYNFGTVEYTWYYRQVSAGYASSAGSATTSTYASNVGSSGTAGTNYVTASKVIAACNWYDTMIGSDSDTVINRWSEIVAFVAGFKETPDLATFLSNNYLAKAGGTMTGPLKWKDNNALPQQTSPQYFLCIDAFDNGGTTKWASKFDTLKELTGLTSTAIGDSDEPVYWNGAKFVKAGAYPTKSSWNYDDRYLKLSGGTLTGVLHLLGSKYEDSANTGALDLANSDIYGVNSIKFADSAESAGEGLQWYRDAAHVDSIWVKNGVIYFSPNRTWGGSVTNYTVWHAGNDGSGSGLDADLLDGKHASDFSLSTHTHDYIAKLRRLNEVFGYSSFASGMFPPALFELKTAGYPVYSDPEFASGYNEVYVYNNYGNGTVTITREQAGDHTNSSGFQLKITTAGEAIPGCGGFYQPISSRANAIFVQIFRAKIPVGYYVNAASNSMGTNYQDKFITDRAGTGKWEWYARVVYCDSSGSFSGGGHVYLSANSGYSATSVTWYLSYCNVIDITKGAYDGLRTRYADSADSVVWSNVTEKPTTISGYGITDAYTKTQIDTKLNGYLPLSGGTLTGVIELLNNNAKLAFGNLATSPITGYKAPTLLSNGVGIYSRYGGSSDEGAIIITEDTCVIYNSSDAGWNFQVMDKDIGTDMTNDATRSFGVNQEHQTWSLGGFVKSGSSDSYVLLGGGGHKAVSDFAAVSSLSNYVLKKPDTHFYNYIGCNKRSNWYKVTFPFHNSPSISNRWMMVSMELILKGNYLNGADGTIYLSYYIHYPANNNVGIADKVYAVAIGSNMNDVRIAYNKADLGIFYVYVPNNYNSFAIQNLSANDTASLYDFTTTTIDALASSAYPVDSEIQDINIRKLYTTDGTSLMLNGNVLIDAGNIGNQNVNSANTSNRTKFLETFQQNSTTTTYGSQYPIWAQWSDATNVRLKCTNYTVWTDKADNAINADKLDNYHENDFFRYRGPLYQKHDYDANTLGIGEYIFRSSGYGTVGTGAEHVNVLNDDSTIQVFKCLQMSAVAWSNSMSYRLRWGDETNAQRPNGWSPWITFISSSNYTEYTVKKDGTGASGTWGISITGSAGSVAWDNVSNKPTFTTWSEISSAASYSLSNAAWTNTITLPTTAGSYILNIVSGNSTLTGVFSIGASDNAKDEISLHLHGNGPRLYARTNGTTLQLSSNDASATSRSVTIKYRRMI